VLDFTKLDILANRVLIGAGVLYFLIIACQRSFRPDVYEMVRLPPEYFIGLILVYIGARWVQKKLRFFNDGSEAIKRASTKILGFIAIFILFGVLVEYIAHNFRLTQQAVGDLRASVDGKDGLGDPIQLGWLITGGVRDGIANYSIPVKGSKTAGQLKVRATKKDGSWHIDELYLILDGNRAVVQIPLTCSRKSPSLKTRVLS
jgi:hypothetical protein